MPLIIIIVLVVVLIILIGENNKKDKENLMLRQKLDEYVRFVNEHFPTENRNTATQTTAPSAAPSILSDKPSITNNADAISAQVEIPNVTEAPTAPSISADKQLISNNNANVISWQTDAPNVTEPVKLVSQPAPSASSEADSSIFTSPSAQSIQTTFTPQQKKPVSTISIVLILGSFFIIIACLIFATADWYFIGNGMRAASILAISAVFFGVSSFSERKLKLKKTGIAFYIMGSLCLPITLLAVGWLRLFGNWLSLTGDGRFVLLTLIFAVSYIAFLKGNIDYKKSGFTVGCAVALCGLINSAFMIFMPANEIFFIISAVYSFALSLLVPLIKCGDSAFPLQKILLKQLNMLAVINTVFIALLSLFLLKNSPISTVSTLLIGAAFLGNAFNKKDGFAGAFPFMLLETLAVCKIIAPTNGDGLAVTLGIVAVMMSVLSLMKLFNDKLRTCMIYLSFFLSAFILLLNMRFPITYDMTPTALIISAVASANILLFAIRRKSKPMYGCFAVSLVLLAYISSCLVTSDLYSCTLVLSLLILIFTVAYSLIKAVPLKSRFSDILFFTVQSFALLVAVRNFSEVPAFFAVSLIALAETVYLAMVSNNGMRKFLQFIIPINLFCAILPLRSLLFGSSNDIFFAIFLLWYAMIFIGGAVNIFTFKSKQMSNVFMLYTVCGGILLPFGYLTSDTVYSAVFMLIFTAYFAIRLIFDKSCNKKIMLGLATTLSVLSVLLLSIGLFRTTAERFFENVVPCLLICAALAAVYYGVYELCKKLYPGNALLRTAYSVTSVILIVISSLLLLICLPSAFAMHGGYTGTFTAHWFIRRLSDDLATAIGEIYSASISAYWIPVIIAAVIAIFSRYRAVSNACALHISALLYIFVIRIAYGFIPQSTQNDDFYLLAVILTVSAAFVLTGRLIHGNKPYGDSKYYIDIFSGVTVIGAFMVLGCGNCYVRWFGLLLAAAYALARLGRPKRGNAPLIAACCGILIIAWWTQPFLAIPRLITAEYFIVPVFLYLGLLMLLFKKSRNGISAAIFVVSVISALVLTLDAIIQQSIFAALIIAILALAVLVISFVVRLKRWFLLSVVTILGFGLYMSVEFHSALSWWVYLLLAGILLITIGSVNELRKQKRRENNDKKTGRFMHEWKW